MPQEYIADGVADSNPNDSGSRAIKRLQQDEILIFGYDTRSCISGVLPDRKVRHSLQTEVLDVLRFESFRRQPARERGRQVGVDQEFHGSVAARVG